MVIEHQQLTSVLSTTIRLNRDFIFSFSDFPLVSSLETQGQSVGPGEKARRKFSIMGRIAPGYRLSPDHSKRSSECWLLIGHKKCFVLLYPIGEQFLLSSFREFVHDGYYLATVAWFAHQAFLTRNEGTTDESKNVPDSISRSNSICPDKILFLTDHNVS